MSRKKPPARVVSMDQENQEMERRAVRALQCTWDVIAGDTFAAVAGEDGRSPEEITMKQDEVIEMVTACGFVGGYPEMYGNDKEAVAWLNDLPHSEQDRICKQAFPCLKYGY